MKIIIATDGSKYGRNAIENCHEMISVPHDARIKIVSIYEAPVPLAAEPFAISADYYCQLENIAKKRAHDAVDTARSYIRDRFGPDINISSNVEVGRPAELIVDIAAEWNADLIVVGSHGHGFWGRMLLGSVSDAVVHHAPCSVLVVRPEHGT